MPSLLSPALAQSLKTTAQQLHNYVELPPLESRILHKHLLNYSDSDLIIHEKITLTLEQQKKLNEWVERRRALEPLAYIINSKEFYSKLFYVDKNVLIPRPETEELVERVIKDFYSDFHSGKLNTLLDLCCGSGCIGITLASHLNITSLFFSDINSEALAICQKNIQGLLTFPQKEKTITLIQSDLFEQFDVDFQQDYFDVVVANPPYVTDAEYRLLDEEVKNYEPKLALVYEPNDDKWFDKMFARIYRCLRPQGSFYCETNPRLIMRQKEQLLKCNFQDVQVIQDLSKKNRFLFARK